MNKLSKSLIFGSLVFIGISSLKAQALAQDKNDSDPTRELQNLVYYPHRHEVVIAPSYLMSLSGNGTRFNSTDTQTQSTSTSIYQMTLGGTFGFSDEFRMNLSETELFDQTVITTNSLTGAQTTNQSTGPSSPTLSALWRAIQNQGSRFYLDATLSVIPTVGTHLAATSAQQGNDLASAGLHL